MATRSKLSAFVRACRPLAHGNIAPPVLFGQALAFSLSGRFSWAAFFLAQAFGLVDHLLIVFANDYADRDADVLNISPTPFSGGSRVLPDGEMSARTIGALAIAMAVTLMVLSALASVPLLLLAIAAIVLIGAYSYPPLRLSYRGGGELLQGLGVGVVLPLVGLTAQGANIDAHVLVLLAPTFVMGVAGNVLTSIPDEDADRAAKKGSPAARWGGERARIASIVLHVAAVIAGSILLGSTLLVLLIALAPVLFSLTQRNLVSRRATLAFVVLGGATEALALLGWSLALVY